MSDKELGGAAGRLGLFKAATRFFRKAAGRAGTGHGVSHSAHDRLEFLQALDRIRGRRSAPKANATVRDLQGFMTPDVNGSPLSQKKLLDASQLTDRQLMNAIFNPNTKAYITAYRDSRIVVEGNHRTFVLLARAEGRSGVPSMIDLDIPIYVNFLPG